MVVAFGIALHKGAGMVKKWNGEFRSLVISEEGNPELYAELERYESRDRTNRLRSLALIGLFALQSRTMGMAGGAIVVEQGRGANEGNGVAPSQQEDRAQRRANKLKSKMLGSLQPQDS